MMKHGMSKSGGAYNSWQMMRRRCYQPSNNRYNIYGARGITVCDRWRDSFENFYADMGPRPDGYSMERKDGNGNYEPSNCVWADAKTQSRNRRSNVHLVLFGLTTPLWKINEMLDIDRSTIYLRAKRHGISYQKSCDHFAVRHNLKTIASCKTIIQNTIVGVAA